MVAGSDQDYKRIKVKMERNIGKREQDSGKMRVSFDLDEVLFVSPDTHKTEPPPHFPLDRIYKERLRLGTPELISELQKMGYEVSVDIMFREEHKIGLKLQSDASSILIGRKGKNLDALQLLLNVYAGHLGREDVRVILDTENYRIRREESLVRLAYTTADKVRSYKKSVLLEPMNPFERRLIHTTLNDIPDIETKSEGDGLYKQVRVLYKGVI